MRAGKIAQMGTPNQLYEDPADAFIADFMGEANVLDGEVLGAGRIALGGVALATAMRDHPPGPAQLAVRPESVTLLPDGEGLPGRVQRAAFLGQTREYEIETPAGQIFVVTPAAAHAFAPGDALVCRLDRVIPLRG
jgi:iron(III) transport system ATP-binding protein